MITYSKYIDAQLHDWYDSSNLLYSKCYDNEGETVTLKVVFSDGRTYVYRDVAKSDYLALKTAESNGKAFGQYIRPKYKGVRISDTSKEQLEQLRQSFIEMEQNLTESRNSDLIYQMRYDDKTGRFALYLGNKRIFRGIEGQVSIINLFKSLNINYGMAEADDQDFVTDENEEAIIINN